MRTSTLLLTASSIGLATVANATLFDFDDIHFKGVAIPLPASYSPTGGGLSPTWTGSWYVMPLSSYGYYGNLFDPPSAPNTIFNYEGETELSFVSPSIFDITQVEFATLAMDNQMQSFSSISVTLAGYRSGRLVGEATVSLVTTDFRPAGFVKVEPNLNGIDTFVVRNDGQSGHYWLMDNLRVTQVPEPERFGFGAAVGLLCLGVFRLVHRRRAAG